MSRPWPPRLPVVQLRIARPTADLDRIVAFYHDGIGLPMIYRYEDDSGYDGAIFGLPDRTYNLEITRRRGDGPCPAPPPDNLLVLYMLDRESRDELAVRLAAMGHTPVPPRNPYWAERGITLVDPDGWHIVLANSHGFGEEYDTNA